MAERLFGLETEYAFTALNAGGASVERKPALQQLMDLTKANLRHLPDSTAYGVFLENGARFYIDCGYHPEMSTPECATPWELVRYVRAGEEILLRLGALLEASEKNISQALFFKSNVDYHGKYSTWGCHESYLHKSDPGLLPRQIIPFLVSRLVFTGAGGFDPTAPGLEFMLSPRVAHLTGEISNNSTHKRGIFHTKDEPLSRRGYHRLHILCGESLGSELATWLKVGTTALVVALIEAGICPGETVQLGDSLKAMRLFAKDSACKAKALGDRGARLSAVAIQRHYLELAEAHVSDSIMPPWAETVCREWRRVLDLLEAGSPALDTILDWKIKLAVFKNRIQQSGTPWESLARWNERLNSLPPPPRLRQRASSLEALLRGRRPVVDVLRDMASAIESRGFNKDEIVQFSQLRHQLFEIDTRFGQLSGNGIFSALDRAGVLQHRVAGVDDIDAAMATPPPTSRARLRGAQIHRLSGNHGRYSCDWIGVWDSERKLLLDLRDPFENEERWVPPAINCSDADAPEEGALGRMEFEWQQIRETS